MNKLVSLYQDIDAGKSSPTKTRGIFGKIEPPEAIKKFSPSGDPSGLIILFNNLLRLLIVAGGIYALINFIIAGYSFMNANNDPKKIDLAWAKIWQSMVGLLIIAVSFVLAALIGKLLFGDATALLKIRIYGPGATP